MVNVLAMTTSIYIIDHYEGDFIALWTKEISKYEICCEISNFGMNNNIGEFEVNIYQNGKLSDFEINGWTFYYNFKGNYQYSETFCTSYQIECIDPYDNEIKLYNTPYKIGFNEEDVLCDCIKMVLIYSQFENADIATKFNYLSRLPEEGFIRGRVRTQMKIKLEDVLKMIKYFKDLYDDPRKDTDEWILNEIKNTVNGAIDFLSNRINKYKIE